MKLESPEISPYIYGQLIFDKWAWDKDSPMQENETGPLPHTTYYSQWINNLTGRAKTKNLVRKNSCKYL